MIELTKVERENKVYVNDKVILLDKDTITPSELLELAGFSSLVYDCYFEQGETERVGGNRNKRKMINKPIDENKKINIEIGMRFNAILKQQQ